MDLRQTFKELFDCYNVDTIFTAIQFELSNRRVRTFELEDKTQTEQLRKFIIQLGEFCRNADFPD